MGELFKVIYLYKKNRKFNLGFKWYCQNYYKTLV
jgi:hypothetical protein